MRNRWIGPDVFDIGSNTGLYSHHAPMEPLQSHGLWAVARNSRDIAQEHPEEPSAESVHLEVLAVADFVASSGLAPLRPSSRDLGARSDWCACEPWTICRLALRRRPTDHATWMTISSVGARSRSLLDRTDPLIAAVYATGTTNAGRQRVPSKSPASTPMIPTGGISCRNFSDRGCLRSTTAFHHPYS